MYRACAIGLAALLVAGCGKDSSPSERHAFAEQKPYEHAGSADPWVLVCRDLTRPEEAYLGGDRAGYRISRDALTIHILRQEGYSGPPEEKLEAIGSPLETTIIVGGRRLSINRDYYSQSLDLRTGELLTTFRFEGGFVEVTHSADSAGDLTENWRIRTVEEAVTRMESSIAEARVVSSSQSDAFLMIGDRMPVPISYEEQNLTVDGSKLIVESAPTTEFLVRRTLSAGDPRADARVPRKFGPRPAVTIDGPREDQDAVRAMLFYLDIVGRSTPPSPFGYSDTTYFGHVFWDADIWVMPAAAFLLPDIAASIADYRLNQAAGYRINYRRWASEEAGRHGLAPDPTNQAAMVPWESSWSGVETVPGPSRRQHHITGSVAWGLTVAQAFGLIDHGKEDVATRLFEGTAEFWRQRSSKRSDGTLEVKGVMSPDEFHVGDNDLYTNLLAQWCMNGRSWKEAKRPFYVPRDRISLLTYDDDRLRSYKQAAALLAVYPLQFPLAEQQAMTMLNRFGDKVTDNGPAMSESIHAIVEARFGDREKAYQRWRESWMPFTDHPLHLFSEKRRKAVTYFVTGAGGCVQAFLFGLLGLRVDETASPGAKWSMPLRGGKVLSIKPNLPKAWRSVKLEGVRLLGRMFDFDIRNDAVVVTPRGA